MAAQTKYTGATAKNAAGGIYDMYHYQVDSRYSEAENGKLRFGMGVVRGENVGSGVAVPSAENTSADFEGVLVNGFTTQHDLEGKVRIMDKQNVGVMRKGRIWVLLAPDAEPSYGDGLHMLTDGDNAGLFSAEGGVEIAGRFIGSASGGIAPVELYGIDISNPSAPSTGD